LLPDHQIIKGNYFFYIIGNKKIKIKYTYLLNIEVRTDKLMLSLTKPDVTLRLSIINSCLLLFVRTKTQILFLNSHYRLNDLTFSISSKFCDKLVYTPFV
jgi:hypothetical protein